MPVDACITDIVKALNDGGVKTRSCCCGHGETSGNIMLMDGRELLIRKNSPLPPPPPPPPANEFLKEGDTKSRIK